jgi:hypothetical protein
VKTSKAEQPLYVKALPLHTLSDIDGIKSEVKLGNVLIVRITPLAKKSVEETKHAINELCDFIKDEGGDIARLGEERIVITPPSIKIWRSKKGASEQHRLKEQSIAIQ